MEQTLGASENTVYIGRKNVMNYVLAVVTQFNQGHGNVNIKARGQSISRAVDVTQIVKSRFVPEMRVAGVELGTEAFTDESGRPSKVSTIHITVAKQ
ncbi:MAG: DNA-binding protein Alba [Candidatus Micrarchaeota archaeon]